jgi:hypothetical protein
MLREDLQYDSNDESAVFRYLSESFDMLTERMGELDQFSVGDGLQVAFEEELILKHEIGPFGRMSRDRGINTYHAGPALVDTSLKYDMPYVGHMDEFERWSQNESVEWKFPDEYVMPKAVRPEYKTVIHKVERDLMEVANSLTGSFHLYHPSEGTLWRTEHMEVAITVSNDRKSEVNEILGKMNKYVTFYDDARSQLSYLGSNGVWDVGLPAKWFALVPSPFQVAFPYNPHSLAKHNAGIGIDYSRNGFNQSFFLPNQPSYYLIPPAAIALKFSCVTDAYFLATNYEPLAAMFTVIAVNNSPLIGFLPRLPAYVNGISQDDDYVYDIEGSGTYASRRHAIQHNPACANKELCPLSMDGDIEVNFFDPKPRIHLDLYSRDGVTSYVGPFCVSHSSTIERNKAAPHFDASNYSKGQCVIYGPFMSNGSVFKDMIGKFMHVPCMYGRNYAAVAIPPHAKRPLLIFRSYKHMVMSQFEICSLLVGRGLKPVTRYGDLGRTQKMPTTTLVEKLETIMYEAPLHDEHGHLGVSDFEVSLKLAIGVGQAESLLSNHPSLIYLGQWNVDRVPRGYWMQKTRFTERRSGRLVTDYWNEWKVTHRVIVEEDDCEYLQWFFYHQGKPVVTIRKYVPDKCDGLGKLIFLGRDNR